MGAIQGIVSRELWNAAVKMAYFAVQCQRNMVAPGGDFLHSVVVNEELAKAGATGPASTAL